MAVTIYRSTDAGAPAVPAPGNYLGASFIMDIFKKCLVTGYGSKAGAGWSLVYEDTTANKRRLAISNGNGQLELITWGNTSLGLVMWESITAPGTGRLYDDSFSTVMSTGVNGWKSKLVAAPGLVSESLMSMNTSSLSTNLASSIAWTVFADDKSAWIQFHYPPTHASASVSNALTTSGSAHPKFFIGAIKSPDLSRDATGNFFMTYGVSWATTNSSVSGSGSDSVSNLFGLRTPWNTLPTVANSSSYAFPYYNVSSGVYTTNPYSSARILLPLQIVYLGADVVKAAPQTTSNGHYCFGFFPGVAQFDSGGSYWVYSNTERGASWNREIFTVGGIDWMPMELGNSSTNSFGITDNSDWWA